MTVMVEPITAEMLGRPSVAVPAPVLVPDDISGMFTMRDAWAPKFPSPELVRAAAASMPRARRGDGDPGLAHQITVTPGTIRIGTRDVSAADRARDRRAGHVDGNDWRQWTEGADCRLVDLKAQERVRAAGERVTSIRLALALPAEHDENCAADPSWCTCMSLDLDPARRMYRVPENLAAASAAKDWRTLGYWSWDGYCAAEFGGLLGEPDDADLHLEGCGCGEPLCDRARPLAADRKILRWSRKSRCNMYRTFHELDYTPWLTRDPSLPFVETVLTYPGQDWLVVAPNSAAVQRHFRAFCKRYARKWGEELVCIWKREFQERGAPHFHVQHIAPVANLRAVREWTGRTWAAIVNHPDPEEYAKHERTGTKVKLDDALKCNDPRRIAVYFAKHGSAAGKEYQNWPPREWRETGESMGRFWGYRGLKPHRATVDAGPAAALAAARVLRRWSRAQGGYRNARVARYPGGRPQSMYPDVIGLAGKQLLETHKARRRKVKRRIRRFGNGPHGWVSVNNAPALALELARFLNPDQSRHVESARSSGLTWVNQQGPQPGPSGVVYRSGTHDLGSWLRDHDPLADSAASGDRSSVGGWGLPLTPVWIAGSRAAAGKTCTGCGHLLAVLDHDRLVCPACGILHADIPEPQARNLRIGAPRWCPACGEPVDAGLRGAGYVSHPCCDNADTTEPAGSGDQDAVPPPPEPVTGVQAPLFADQLPRATRKVSQRWHRAARPARTGSCPACQTATLTYGRETCQSCAMQGSGAVMAGQSAGTA